LTEIAADGATSRERKIKSRTEIRRADKIELKNVIRGGVSSLFSESWKSRISIDFPENPENQIKAI
jgi:hypothetical protein